MSMGRFISMGRANGRAPVDPATIVAKPTHIRNPIGFYESNGSWHQQTVHLSFTRNGQPGLFTGGMLVWSLDSDTYAALSTDPAALRAYVNARGFELKD